MHIEGYVLGKVLGEGAFAQTRIGHCENDPDAVVAVKTVLKFHPRYDRDELQREIEIMQKINHPHCCGLIEVWPHASRTVSHRPHEYPTSPMDSERQTGSRW
jgi:serine/threonine protein kinase